MQPKDPTLGDGHGQRPPGPSARLRSPPSTCSRPPSPPGVQHHGPDMKEWLEGLRDRLAGPDPGKALAEAYTDSHRADARRRAPRLNLSAAIGSLARSTVAALLAAIPSPHSDPLADTPAVTLSDEAIFHLVDPCNRLGKIQIPVTELLYCVGSALFVLGHLIGDVGSDGSKCVRDAPSLCLSAMSGRCRMGASCNQVHACPVYVDAVRKWSIHCRPDCCMQCLSQKRNVPLPPNPRTIKITADGTVPPQARTATPMFPITVAEHQFAPGQRISPTNPFLASYPASCCGNNAVVPVSALSPEAGEPVSLSLGVVCAAHQLGSCKYGRDCVHVHLCREVLANAYALVGPRAPHRLEPADADALRRVPAAALFLGLLPRACSAEPAAALHGLLPPAFGGPSPAESAGNSPPAFRGRGQRQGQRRMITTTGAAAQPSRLLMRLACYIADGVPLTTVAAAVRATIHSYNTPPNCLESFVATVLSNVRETSALGPSSAIATLRDHGFSIFKDKARSGQSSPAASAAAIIALLALHTPCTEPPVSTPSFSTASSEGTVSCPRSTAEPSPGHTCVETPPWHVVSSQVYGSTAGRTTPSSLSTSILPGGHYGPCSNGSSAPSGSAAWSQSRRTSSDFSENAASVSFQAYTETPPFRPQYPDILAPKQTFQLPPTIFSTCDAAVRPPSPSYRAVPGTPPSTPIGTVAPSLSEGDMTTGDHGLSSKVPPPLVPSADTLMAALVELSASPVASPHENNGVMHDIINSLLDDFCYDAGSCF